MTKVDIQEKFNTAMGLIVQVKNEHTFRVDDVVSSDDGEYKIKKIMFSSNPDKDDFVNLLVSKLN